MRQLLLAVAATTVVGCSLYHDIEDDRGFRGVRLGVGPDQVEGIRKLDEDGLGGAVHVPTTPPEPWGKAPIAIRYHFFDDRLWKIVIRTDDSKALLPELTGRYGTPPFSTPWEWHGETVRMKFRGTEYDSTATVTMVDESLEASRASVLDERRTARDEAEKADAARSSVAREAAEDGASDTDTDTDGPSRHGSRAD